MKESAKLEILQLARVAAESAVRKESYTPSKPENNPELYQESGCFVTLKNRGRLRGCIGRFVSHDPLYQLVAEMARAAACEDPRFLADPITSDELDDLTVEVSVLSPLKRIENPLQLELGKHGIYIKKGYQAGCFLPQVATETGWNKEEFLTQCAVTKAGLTPDAWRDSDTEVYVFTADIFEED